MLSDSKVSQMGAAGALVQHLNRQVRSGFGEPGLRLRKLETLDL